MIEHYKELLYPNLTIPNYKEMCELLEEKTLDGENKKAQLCEWRRYFKYKNKEIEQSFLIEHIYNKPLKYATDILTKTRDAENQKAEDDTKNEKVNIRDYINMQTIPRSIDRKAKIYVPFEDRLENISEIVRMLKKNDDKGDKEKKHPKLEDYPLEEHLIKFIECMYENKSQMKERIFAKRLDDELSCLDELADYLLFCKGHEYSKHVKGYKCLSVSKFQYHDSDGFTRENYRKDRKYNCVSVDDIHETMTLKIGDHEYDRENTIYTQIELIEERGLLDSVYNCLDNKEEKDIIDLVGCGCRTADICRILSLTESKVNTRVKRIKGKISSIFNRENQTLNTPTTKICRKCTLELPLERFGKDTRNKKDGRKSYCRECINTEKRDKGNKIIKVV